VGNEILELDPKFYLNKRLKPKKAIISDSLSAFAPPIGESCKFDAMISLINIKKNRKSVNR
jgi:hypothetical protein